MHCDPQFSWHLEILWGHCLPVRGGIKKTVFFFRKTPKKKTGDFGYFCQKGVSHPIHRDFIMKKLRIFRNFSPKGGGVSPNSLGFYHKKLRIFRNFSLKRGGSRQFQNFLIRRNWGFQIAWGGRRGLRDKKYLKVEPRIFWHCSGGTEDFLKSCSKKCVTCVKN